MNRVPVFDVKKGSAPPEHLGRMVSLDAQPLLQVDPANALFQPPEFDCFLVYDYPG